MLRIHLKTAWRNLLQQRQYSAINITGLAIGMSCCIFISLYVRDEISFDRYHSGAGRIFRITRVSTNTDGQSEHQSQTMKAVAYTLRRELPEVEAATTILQSGQLVVAHGDNRFYETRVYEADSNLFRVFDFPFVKGSANDVLKTSKSVVITESMWHKYFGDKDPIGEPLRIRDTDMFVEGVVKDVPANSHFHFDFLVPLRTFEIEHNTQWLGMRGYHTYVKLRQQADPANFETNLRAHAIKADPKSTDQYFIQPLTDIHLTSKLKGELEPNGDEATIRILVSIAIIIILVACINYVNLATARAIRRGKEVGVRKTSGARRGTLVAQFLTESVLTAMLSFVLSVILLIIILPAFNQLTGKQFELFSPDLTVAWMFLAALAIVLGLLSGIYPALYLSSLDPAKVLKTGTASPAAGSSLRKTLVVLQYVISISLVIGTITIARQMDYIVNRAPGFDKDMLIVIDNAGSIPGRQVLEQRMEQLAGVKVVGSSTTMPGRPGWTGSIRADHATSDRLINFSQIDYEYLEAMGIRVIEGRNFSRNFPIDTINTIIINQTAVRELNLSNPVGQRMIWAERRDTTVYATVIGVVNDFHYASFREPIQPFAFLVRNDFFVMMDFTSKLFVKTGDVSNREILPQLETVWKEFVPDRPFTYLFMDESFREWHAPEQKFKDVFMLLTGLSLFIAALGLFALVAFVSEQRRKEIGIRKVMGASVSNIVVMINKEFTVLICVALIISAPLAWFFASKWLENFAYHASLEWWMFVLAGAITFTVAIISTAYQSFRASIANPVDSIRAD
ncbi:MAG TPA: ABC transporter permease [Cyclobacteriaceae bacterium]|nr:ABC transporter permease [Cyclobacteriaceae bacterium]